MKILKIVVDELPKECFKCHLCHQWECAVLDDLDCENNKRRKDCPLEVQVEHKQQPLKEYIEEYMIGISGMPDTDDDSIHLYNEFDMHVRDVLGVAQPQEASVGLTDEIKEGSQFDKAIHFLRRVLNPKITIDQEIKLTTGEIACYLVDFSVQSNRQLLVEYETWKTDNDIKNLLPDQLADWYIEIITNLKRIKTT